MNITLEKFKGFTMVNGYVSEPLSKWLKENTNAVPVAVDYKTDFWGGSIFITYIESNTERRVEGLVATEFVSNTCSDALCSWKVYPDEPNMDEEARGTLCQENMNKLTDKINCWRAEHSDRVIISVNYSGKPELGYYSCLILHAPRPQSQAAPSTELSEEA